MYLYSGLTSIGNQPRMAINHTHCEHVLHGLDRKDKGYYISQLTILLQLANVQPKYKVNE